jgi:beta-phosphoglucomutase-like phosphatase (HAD superfamily)
MPANNFNIFNSPQAVLWDLDGVLVQTDHLWKNGYVEQTLLNGHLWQESDTKACRGKTGDDIAKHLATIFNPEIALKIVDEVEKSVIRGMDHTVLPTHSIEILDYYYQREVPMVIVTSSIPAVVEQYLTLLPKNYFSFYLTSKDTAIGKPDPQGYNLVMSRLSLSSEKCLVFEDSDTGIQAGVNSGSNVVALPRTQNWENSPRLSIYTSLSEFYFKNLL